MSKEKDIGKYFDYGVRCSNCRWYKCNDCDLGNDIYKKCKDFEVAP